MPEVGSKYIVTINDKKMSGEIVKETPKNYHFLPDGKKTVKVLSKNKFTTEFKGRKVAGEKRVKAGKTRKYFKDLAKESKQKKDSTRTKKKVTKEEFEEARRNLKKTIYG
jgi:hypothetical protein